MVVGWGEEEGEVERAARETSKHSVRTSNNGSGHTRTRIARGKTLLCVCEEGCGRGGGREGKVGRIDGRGKRSLLSPEEEMVMVVVVATLTRLTAACPVCQEERCAGML